MITWRKLPEDDNVRKGFVDWDDYRRFLAELPDELKMLLVFGFHYGIRKSELLTYQWPYVDFFSKEIRVPQPHTKNREPKIIPFYGDVPHWLDNQGAIGDSKFPDSLDLPPEWQKSQGFSRIMGAGRRSGRSA